METHRDVFHAIADPTRRARNSKKTGKAYAKRKTGIRYQLFFGAEAFGAIVWDLHERCLSVATVAQRWFVSP